jgi:ribosomal protein L3 glutamine methyltransferase
MRRRARAVHHRRHRPTAASSPDLPAGDRVRPDQRQHPQDRRARARWPSLEPLKNIYRRTLERLLHMKLMDPPHRLRRAPASTEPPGAAGGGRFVWPRHHQRLRRGGLAGAVALGLPLDDLDAVAVTRVTPAEQARRRGAGRRAHRAPASPRPTSPARPGCRACPSRRRARAIVPRSLIAELARRRHARRLADRPHRRVLDLCTGNGSLAVLAALAWPEVQVDAADLSADALAVARLNVERHGLGDRIRAAQGDGLAAAGPYDLILCNPPYVNRSRWPRCRRVPRRAGAGAGRRRRRHGLRAPPAARRPAHLAADGVLVLEIGHERAHFEAAFPALEPPGCPPAPATTRCCCSRARPLA